MSAVTILGIETSCDETAAAVLRLEDGQAAILSETVRSQVEAHAPYGGVVPEIAARAHADIADQVVAKTLEESGLALSDLDGVAATSGPGLIGGVMVGMMTGKAIALAAGKPFIPVNHLEGHALSPRLGADCPFPYLLLLVSGGHCQFIEMRRVRPSTSWQSFCILAFRAVRRSREQRRLAMQRAINCRVRFSTGQAST